MLTQSLDQVRRESLVHRCVTRWSGRTGSACCESSPDSRWIHLVVGANLQEPLIFEHRKHIYIARQEPGGCRGSVVGTPEPRTANERTKDTVGLDAGRRDRHLIGP